MSERASALQLAREVLRGQRCWVVGGAVRDELLGAGPSIDLDLVVDGEVAAAARALARAARGKAFSLSDDFGAWRVVARARGWQADLNPLRGDSLESDLLLRDFTINAIARPLEGGELIDPSGGAADLAASRLRLVAPSALAGVSSERVYAELRRVIASERPRAGIALALDLGLCAVVLPELELLRGIEQSRYHHLDALEHTLAVLDCAVELERRPEDYFGEPHGAAVRALLELPLADELTRAGGLRLGALMHDIAKPQTRAVAPDGRVGFPGHDRLGADTARAILSRLRAAERIRAHVSALTRHHLRLGFLVPKAPLGRRELYDYLDACDPVWADVTLLSVADRLATRGARSDEAIERHLTLARSVIGEALSWQRHGRPPALLPGDQLAAALGIEPGPLLGELLAEIAREAFAGELRSPQDAIAFAAARLA